jgi:hypothetical protein
MGFELSKALGASLPIVGDIINYNTSKRRYNYARQDAYHDRERDDTQIQRRVADAKKAGIHPLAALGAGSMYSPGTIVGGNYQADMSNMGQNISRALSKSMSGHQQKIASEQLKSLQLENDFKRIEIQKSQRELGDSNEKGLPGINETLPSKRDSHHSSKVHQESASTPSVKWYKNADRSLSPIPAGEAKKGMEDMLPAESSWLVQNYIKPIFASKQEYNRAKPPKSKLPKGAKDWEFRLNPPRWVPIYQGKSRTPWRRIKEAAKEMFDNFLP